MYTIRGHCPRLHCCPSWREVCWRVVGREESQLCTFAGGCVWHLSDLMWHQRGRTAAFQLYKNVVVPCVSVCDCRHICENCETTECRGKVFFPSHLVSLYFRSPTQLTPSPVQPALRHEHFWSSHSVHPPPP